jgi:hypothetical protein
MQTIGVQLGWLVPVFVLPECRCWSANPTERPSIDMLLECLELMIEARQDEAGP